MMKIAGSRVYSSIVLVAAAMTFAGKASAASTLASTRFLTKDWLFDTPPPTEPQSEPEHWRATGLKLQHFIDDASPKCQLSLPHFRGCWAALEAITALQNPNHRIAFEDEKAGGRPDLGELLKTLKAPIAIYQIKPISNLDAIKRAHEIRLTAITSAFKKQIRVPFLDWFRVLGSKMIQENTKNESYYVSILYNRFLAYAEDPHARLMPLSLIQQEQEGDRIANQGIGAIIQSEVLEKTAPPQYRHRISRVYENSPAHRAGLRVGDEIVHVQGQDASLHGIVPTDVQLRDARRKNGHLRFNLKKLNGELREIHIEVGSFRTPNVQSRLLPPVQLSANAAYQSGWIQIGDFMDQNLFDDFVQAYRGLLKQGAHSIIIDLQNNPGGSLLTAAKMAGWLLGKESIVFGVSDIDASVSSNPKPEFFSFQSYVLNLLRNLDGDRFIAGLKSFNAELKNFRSDLFTPIVVLQNAGSASASELLAGALQDHQRAWVLGDRSFGKGTVQGPAPFPFKTYTQSPSSPKIGFWKTLLRFHQPSGRSNQIQGIIPNFWVPVSTVASELSSEDTAREEDYFEGALPSLNQPWFEPRPKLVLSIDQCRNQLRYAEEQEANESSNPDLLQRLGYRVFSAQEVLYCQNLL